MVYYSRSPESRESISSLMALTGKAEDDVKKAVGDFTEKHILSMRWSNNKNKNEPQYYVSPKYKEILEKLRLGLRDRHCRMRLMMLALDNIRNHHVTTTKETL